MSRSPDGPSYAGPPLTEPATGRPLTANGELAYRQRRSAVNQARHWNAILEGDPFLGAESGFVVGVAPLVSETSDGPRFELIWMPAPISESGE